MNTPSHTFALILAGGGGTRLWPKSREKTPKQFLKLGGEKTLLRTTAERVRKLVDWDHMYIITNVSQLADVKKNLPEISDNHILCEPMKRETAMAMAVGALVIQARDPEAVVMNFASDHVVQNPGEFMHVMETAAQTASDGNELVTVGISPTFPHTGLGYIKIGKELCQTNKLPVFTVENFTEKPNTTTATAFLTTGKYFWNANNYVWSCRAIERAFEKYAPNTALLLIELKKHIGKPEWEKALHDAYERTESISIDYAISEKADNLLLIPGDFGWNDVGDWKVVYDLAQKDQQGNVILREEDGGEIVEYQSHDNLVSANGRLVALVDVENMIVIDTKEILLVMPKSKSQDVKKIVEKLKEEKKKEYL
ncbi:MAG: mannose-1-phosphate guanylyltransferase [Candidatus Pacebacteria bacterium]|nr:mannose-1-phosphate guanylyltransferase [Candidatus Paceibacterota bacterium]